MSEWTVDGVPAEPATARLLDEYVATLADRYGPKRGPRTDNAMPEVLDALVADIERTAAALDPGPLDDDPLATDESPQGLAQAYAWWHFQNGYRRSQASPPERSIGCEADIEHLRALANAWGRPDPREVVEIGMEHLWQIVYGEPYPTGRPATPTRSLASDDARSILTNAIGWALYGDGTPDGTVELDAEQLAEVQRIADHAHAHLVEYVGP